MKTLRTALMVALAGTMSLSLLAGPAAASDPPPGTVNDEGILIGDSREGSGQAQAPADGLNAGGSLSTNPDVEIPGNPRIPTPNPTFTPPDATDFSSEGEVRSLGCRPGYSWHPQCRAEDSGVSYRAFSNMGYGGVGNAYRPGSLPITITLKIEPYEYAAWCTTKEVRGWVDGEWVVIDPPRTFECRRYSNGFSAQRDANPVVTPATRDVRFNTRCTTRHTFPGVFDEGGRAYSAPFVGYKVKWWAGIATSATESGFVNDLKTYECLPPATATQVNDKVCYRHLEGRIDVFMPNPQTPNGPTTNLPGIKDGSFPEWEIFLPRQLTAYGTKMDEVLRARDRGASQRELRQLLIEAYDACMTQTDRLEYDFERDTVTDWGWGRYDVQILGGYDIVSAVRLTDSDYFGGRPEDFIVLDRTKLWDNNKATQVATYLDPAPDNQDRVWRSITHMYCEPASKITNPENAFANQDYINKVKYWRNGKKLPEGITYTANDCAPPDGGGGGENTPGPGAGGNPEAVNTAPATWRCTDDGFTSFADATVGTTRLQSQADNLRRNAQWSPIRIAGEGETVRNVTNKTVRYLATSDSSPRLVGSDVYAAANQPFTFTPRLGEVVSGWDDDDRTLGVQFKEASRDGRDFRIWPYYRFEAEFKNMQFTVNGIDLNTGQLDFVPRIVWTPSPGVCLSDMITVDVRRVGSVTANRS